MPKSPRKAGQNIRELASKRRAIAGVCFAASGLFLYLPFWFHQQLNSLISTLSSEAASQVQPAGWPLSIFYVVFFIISVRCFAKGKELWQRANYAAQGAEGEEKVSQELRQLSQEGWTFEYGTRLYNRLGDADVVCTSPRNQVFVIDVKSHRGMILTDGKQLIRRVGNRTYPFKKDIVAQVMKQALQVKKQKDLNFVTPILAFSEASVSVPPGKLRHVYVVERSRLCLLLRKLG